MLLRWRTLKTATANKQLTTNNLSGISEKNDCDNCLKKYSKKLSL
jgi:hypothetical protein